MTTSSALISSDRTLLQSVATIARGLLLLWVFAIFPVLVLQIAIRQIEHMEIENLIRHDQARLEKRLARLARLGEDIGLLSHLLRSFLPRMSTIPMTQRLRLMRRLQWLFPRAFDVYWFDREGRLIQELSSRRHPRRATEMAFANLRNLKKGNLTPNQEGLLMSFLRTSSLSGLQDSQGHTYQLLRRDTDGYLVWSVLSPNTASGTSSDKTLLDDAPRAFMALLHPGKLRRNRALAASIKLFRRLYPQDRYGLANLSKGKLYLWPRSLRLHGNLSTSLLAALARYDKHFVDEGIHVTLLQRKPNEYLLAVAKRPNFLRPLTWSLINFSSITWIFLVLWRLVYGKTLLWGPISFRLFGLFFFAVGTPALVLLVVGFYALRDHTNVLRQNLENRMREKLAQYDQRLPNELARIENWVISLINEARRLHKSEQRNAIFEKFRQEKTIDQVLVVDKTGSASFILNIPPSSDSILRKRIQFLIILCREMLRRLNKSVVFDAGSLMAEATESMFDTLVGERGKKTDFNRLAQELGRFTLLSFIDEATYLYLDAFFDTKGSADSLFLAHVPRVRLERSYLEKTLGDLIRQPDLVWRVNAMGDSPRVEAVIRDSVDLPIYERICQEVKSSHSAVSTITVSRSEETLWVAMPGQNISRFILVARTSLSPLYERVRILWGWLLLVALMVFVSTAVFAVLLLENILAPVASLETGISYIRKRQFDHRIPIHADDELGHVSMLMNTMIEGMSDLQVAKIVQESLFPAAPLTIGPYKIYGHSRSMADIGGDYFDYFLTPDGKLLGLIGDVSGHGVSAALIMGMAKCALTLDETPGRTLTDLLGAFNRFLIKTIKRRKMMTMFCFLVDPQTHILTFANAGHNFPFLILGETLSEKKEKAEIIELIQEAMPLGVRAIAKFLTIERELKPGDTLLLYTDGFVEANRRDGEQVGYDLAKEWFLQVAHLPPEQVVERLFAIFDEHTYSDRPSDDVSLICLKRLE